MITIPDDMDVPRIRRDTNNPDNVRWLVRNLAVRNSQHLEFKKIFSQLVKLQAKHRSVQPTVDDEDYDGQPDWEQEWEDFGETYGDKEYI